ncbi:SDH family Clp fold serine proteinase [Candidatus Contubernalis alkaliaceticus]|uniref:SDH family Clp fold serine proteinase n=1 Tax=Candidatus Contubernalis alkaliaceticus TaxID=338645 RepID=UPI001F4C500B|nr:hypothetical protein [Candidatus Contubernalis alkalaceticus]UNC91932.1 hypothetical protein HUE98_07380 [Candidatus Contubernalis alkalaceticus]
MERSNRINLINQIQEELNASIICYVTGDRENLSTRIAPDVIRIFYQHLEKLKHQKNLCLFLYTRGGDVLTPWRLVNLIREYCSHFSVLLPFRGYSAGTLICLGADDIIMGKMSELSPIDPSVANAFNPEDPYNKTAKIPVSVEDVSSFLNLAREKALIKEDEHMAQIFLRLSKKVHPLALGNVHRNYSLIRSLAEKLLELHSRERSPEHIKEIIDNLTEKLYAHNHMISRYEAQKYIKLHVVEPNEKLESLAWTLYENYENELQLSEPFNPAVLMKEHEQQVDFEATGGIIESIEQQHAFIFEGRVTRHTRPKHDNAQIKFEMLRQGWRLYNN